MWHDRGVTQRARTGGVALVFATGLAACLAGSSAGCGSSSEVERQRDAAVAAAEREVPRSPTGGLKREGPLTKADRQAWQPVLQWPSECEEAFAAAGNSAGLTFHPAGAGVSIVDVLCSPDPDRPSHVFIRFDERGSSPVATPLAFPGGHLLTGLAVLTPDAHTLSVLAFDRAAKDCGTWTRYNIRGERPRVMASARQACTTPAAPAVTAFDGATPAGWAPVAITPP